MTAPVFVDTNVLVYAYDAGEPLKQPVACHWLERLWREQAGRTSIQVLSEYYVTLTRKIKPALDPTEAWDHVRDLLTWNPQPVDAALLARGREVEARYRLSWWDSLIVAAAQLQDCAILLSEDMQDRAIYGSVTVRNPFVASVSEEPATYSVTRVRKLEHPRRGRPRKRAA